MSQTNPFAIKVECYSGYRGEETPLRFYLGQRLIEIDEVLDRWLDPYRRYFKVRSSDGAIYIICHDVNSCAWEMTLFNSGTQSETRLSST